eukprot:854689-Pelagomonas_calceolata.AAC.12
MQAASECNLVESLMGLLSRVVDKDATGVTIDTLEGVTYLLQRMMVGEGVLDLRRIVCMPDVVHAGLQCLIWVVIYVCMSLALGCSKDGVWRADTNYAPCCVSRICRRAAVYAAHSESNLSSRTVQVTILLVCLEPKHKEQLRLAEYLESAAKVMVNQLHEAANSGSDSPETQRAIRASLLAIRELTWDDHNGCIEPGLSAMAAAGAFEAVAGGHSGLSARAAAGALEAASKAVYNGRNWSIQGSGRRASILRLGQGWLMHTRTSCKLGWCAIAAARAHKAMAGGHVCASISDGMCMQTCIFKREARPECHYSGRGT